MKRMFYILLAVLCIACVGQKEDVMESDLQFVADKAVLSVDKNESATFSVLLNGVDVTAASEIYQIEDGAFKKLEEPVFAPADEGEFNFQAYYSNVPTQMLNILAVKGNGSENGSFYKKWMVMKFTATWCVNCPAMSDAIKALENEFPGRIVDVAVHYIDELEAAEGRKLAEHFNVSAIPVAVVDMDEDSQTSVASTVLLSNSINEVVEANLPVCGIKLASFRENENLVVDVEGKITGDGKYKLAVAILQDGLAMAQTGAGSDYVHNGVLVKMLQEDVMGADAYELKAGDIVSKRFECLTGGFAADGNYRLAAFILKECGTGKYIVNNITECKLYGSADYLYEVPE